MYAQQCLTLCDPWTVACQAPLSMGFSRQEYWSGLTFSSPGDLPDPRLKPASPALVGRFFTPEPPGKFVTHIALDKVHPISPALWSALYVT